MAIDKRLFDSSSMTRPPTPPVDEVTSNIDEGFAPEPASILKATIEALNEMDRIGSTPPTDSVDEILHHVRLHGEAFIRFAGDSYRVTFDAAGNVRSERLADADPFVAKYASSLADNMLGDVGFRPSSPATPGAPTPSSRRTAPDATASDQTTASQDPQLCRRPLR
ncbi:hypothetical protein [Bradyrhizobium sp. WYCCWR 12699]|uniref:hypothetical protein n=1 Tax=Bradyrhizobium sp. WYCCWR 12699 TaxID=3064203 RepID=UPI0028A4E6F1|nr:hypothetical protein [Bradyrhizobium sp. WYCCWR 12699]MDT4740249.1 hypothetical protein [Bradyrhizobium sp. WYCCWR 12699]